MSLLRCVIKTKTASARSENPSKNLLNGYSGNRDNWIYGAEHGVQLTKPSATRAPEPDTALGVSARCVARSRGAGLETELRPVAWLRARVKKKEPRCRGSSEVWHRRGWAPRQELAADFGSRPRGCNRRGRPGRGHHFASLPTGMPRMRASG